MHATVRLADLGWDEDRNEEFAPFMERGLTPGRVATDHGTAATVLTERGEVLATPTGKSRRAGPPAAGDWIALEELGDGRGVIHALLDRRTVFSRKVAWLETDEQVIAANVDVILVVAGLDGDLNPRRLERYLAAAWEGGAQPVVVLTKPDLCTDLKAALESLAAVAAGADVHVVDNLTGDGVEAVRVLLRPTRTAVLVGSSGVGKSTLINNLLGEEVLKTGEVRWDGKGRHTTTHRELMTVRGGGCVLDTPGMRELQLWGTEAGLDAAFDDVARLASGCKFNDCRHDREPGCAVRAAIEAHALDPDRLASYRKLQRELRYLETRVDKRARSEESKRWRKLHGEARARSRDRGGRR
ncbi:MAG TPA: ribosome small subunit-dependent GTPase A [Actinomycetota bacterium]|nr:ribosome small subunit-dependent GTPase A [Actinomycetota bacterium]